MTESRLGIIHIISTGFLQIREGVYEPLLPWGSCVYCAGRGPLKWSKNRGRKKGGIWLTYGFCWSLATDLRPRSGFLGPSNAIPKPTRKPFQIYFISSVIVIVLSKIPRPRVRWGADPPLPKSRPCQVSLAWDFPPAAAADGLCLPCQVRCVLWNNL